MSLLLLNHRLIIFFADELWRRRNLFHFCLRNMRASLSTESMCLGWGCWPSFFPLHGDFIRCYKKRRHNILFDNIGNRSSPSHLIFLGLRLAKRNVLLCCFFVKCPSTSMTLNHTVSLGLSCLFKDTSFLLCWLMIWVLGLLYTSS